MDDWLARARDALAPEAGVDTTELDLSDENAKTLLARIAAVRQGAADLDTLADAVRRSTS